MGFHKWGYWKEFQKRIEAMKPNELLIWEIEKRDLNSRQVRIRDLNTADQKMVTHYCDGKLFILRLR